MSKQTDLINIPDAITVSGSNVGIGTSSPTFTSAYGGLHIHSTYPELHLTGTDSGSGASDGFRINKNSANHVYLWNYENANIVFATNNSERMRIDSSGNLLVGTTDALPVANNDSSGIALRADGNAQFSRSGAATARFNRGTSDGEIVSFSKDGSSVGSIASHSGRIAIGSGDTGLQFLSGNDAILPADPTTPANRDGAVTLGWSDVRFKDLYLSGGVYLGGTGAANKLEDYEEGTWTAVDGSGNAYNSQGIIATYTKIGRIVYINFDVTATASTSGYQIAGLPFTASPNSVTGNWSVYGGYSTSNADIWGHINQNSTAIGMYVGSGGHTLNGRWIGAGFYYTEQ